MSSLACRGGCLSAGRSRDEGRCLLLRLDERPADAIEDVVLADHDLVHRDTIQNLRQHQGSRADDIDPAGVQEGSAARASWFIVSSWRATRRTSSAVTRAWWMRSGR